MLIKLDLLSHYPQPLAGQWVCVVRSSLYGLRHLCHVPEPLPYSEGQRSRHFIQLPLSSDSEGFPHQGLDVGPPSPGAASHFHAHHTGKKSVCLYMWLV